MTRNTRARVVCARILLAYFLVAYPLPLFSVRRKESPSPVTEAPSVFVFRGGAIRLCQASPAGVSFPVDRSWKLLCACWLTEIRFHSAHCNSG